MRCAWVQERLLLYLAGELPPREAAGLVRHLERCAACTAQAEGLAEMQAQVDASLPTTVEAPAALDARVMATVRGLPAPRRSWGVLPLHSGWPGRLAWVPAALCLLMAGFYAGSWNATRTRPVDVGMRPALSLGQLGDAHRHSLANSPSEEFRASDSRQLAQDLQARTPFPIGVVDLRSEGLRLVGGSRSTIRGLPVAVLQYEWEGERVSLFEVDARHLSPPALQQVVFPSDSYFVKKMGGLTYAAWSLGRTNCVMVTHTMPMHILFRFACHASEKLERI